MVEFSRAQSNKLAYAQARADDISAAGQASYNTGVQESKDDAAYKIFADRLKLLNDQALRNYKHKTGQADVLSKAVGLGSKALNLIPGVGPIVAAVAGTALTEGTRYAAGGYDGFDDKQIKSLGLPNTLFKRKTVRHNLLESRDDILDGYEDAEEARKINLAIGAITNLVSDSMANKEFDSTKPAGSPFTQGELIDSGDMDFGEGLRATFLGGVRSEDFYDKSISAYVAKNGVDKDLNPFLRSLYNLYPGLTDKFNYDREEDIRTGSGTNSLIDFSPFVGQTMGME